MAAARSDGIVSTRLVSGASGARVSIGIAPNFEVTDTQGADYPAFCTLSGTVGSQTLDCDVNAFASGANVTFTYNAVARGVGTSSSVATIAPPAGVTDGDAANNSLTINPTVRQGVDLQVTKIPNKNPPNYVGGETVTYTIQPSNSRPNASAVVRMTDTLAPLSDLDSVTASGTNWTCAPSGATHVCNRQSNHPNGAVAGLNKLAASGYLERGPRREVRRIDATTTGTTRPGNRR